MPPKDTSRADAIQTVVAEMDGPLTFDEFAQRVLQRWQGHSKNPRALVRNDLRYDYLRLGLLFIDDARRVLLPVRLAMQGLRFRLPLSQAEVDQGVLIADRTAGLFFDHWDFAPVVAPATQLRDSHGALLETVPATVAQQVHHPLFGSNLTKRQGFALPNWFRDHHIQAADAVLLTVIQWSPLILELEYEPAHARQDEQIQQRNAELADVLYEVLEHAQDERLHDREALMIAHLRLGDPKGYPGDPWPAVLQADGRMIWSSNYICYIEDSRFSDWTFAEVEEADQGASPLSPVEAGQVFRFKAAFQHRPSLWRRIEIGGDQTLADFNRILVSAFKHDGDHLGGFWRRARRGQTNRYREIGLGSVDPFGDGEGAKVRIAEIGLDVGDELKYVYDFGDWIEHQLTLEEIRPAKQSDRTAQLPRIVEQNKPRRRYCRDCQDEGRRTLATWVCITCSNDIGEEVLICEECLTQYHEDHYADEIVY